MWGDGDVAIWLPSNEYQREMLISLRKLRVEEDRRGRGPFVNKVGWQKSCRICFESGGDRQVCTQSRNIQLSSRRLDRQPENWRLLTPGERWDCYRRGNGADLNHGSPQMTSEPYSCIQDLKQRIGKTFNVVPVIIVSSCTTQMAEGETPPSSWRRVNGNAPQYRRWWRFPTEVSSSVPRIVEEWRLWLPPPPNHQISIQLRYLKFRKSPSCSLTL